MRRLLVTFAAFSALSIAATAQASTLGAAFESGPALSLHRAAIAAADWGRAQTNAGIEADGCHRNGRRTVYCSVQTLQEVQGEIWVLPVVVRLMPIRRLIYVNYENGNVPFYEPATERRSASVRAR